MGEVCAARDRLNHRDRMAWLHTAHMMTLTANIHTSKKTPYEISDFYPYELPDAKIKLPNQEHEQMFEFMKNMLSNGEK